MSDRIHELLNRNLQEVFGEGDAARCECTQKFALQHPLAFERTSLLPPRRGGPSGPGGQSTRFGDRRKAMLEDIAVLGLGGRE